ncbi:MAG TPA: hypothetical protein VEY93_10435, partial [Longimicrobium sp.]|nr:hypothetical protein [Longimicrobium sp.]
MIQIADVLSTPLEYARLSREELAERIRRRKQELNAVILGHNYQRVDRRDELGVGGRRRGQGGGHAWRLPRAPGDEGGTRAESARGAAAR